MQAVNLLPSELARGDKSKLDLRLLGAGATPAIALVLVVTGYTSAHGQIASKRAELDASNAKVAKLAPANAAAQARVAVENARTSQLVVERAARMTALEAALVGDPGIDSFLDQFTRDLPSDVWLTTLDYTPASGTLSFGGDTYSEKTLAGLIARLQLLPNLTKIQLTGNTETTVGSKTLVSFTVTATPVLPAPPATTTDATTTTPATTPTTTTPAP